MRLPELAPNHLRYQGESLPQQGLSELQTDSLLTPIPDAVPDVPPVPARELVINRTPSGDPPPLPGR